MSGEDVSKKVEEAAAKLHRHLDEYEASLGLPSMAATQFAECEGTRLLTLSAQALKQMTAIDCGEASFALSQYCVHLQRAMNRERALCDWAEDMVRFLIAKKVGDAKGYSWEERRAVAVASSPLATEFEKLRRYTKNRINATDYLANRVDAMIKTLQNLQMSKRGHRD